MKMISIKAFLFTISASILQISIPLYAGWTSSGGETLKDKINPWFLKNTKVVNYCVLVDNNNFGQGAEIIKRRVRKSFDIWKYQLQKLRMKSVGGSIIDETALKLATQTFNEVPCSITNNKIEPQNIDITFQFGVLTGEQIKNLGDPTKYIGVTVRTDYDTINLKGKGFVYVSPETGPLKLNKAGLREKLWSKNTGRDLLNVLLHEMGHIFGIQHTPDLNFMEEGYLDNLLSASNDYADDDDTLPYEKDEGDIFYLVDFFRFEVPDNFQFDINCRVSSRSEASPAEPIKPEDPDHSLFNQLILQNSSTLKNRTQKKHSSIHSTLDRIIEKKFFGYHSDPDAKEEKICFNIIRNGSNYRFEFTKETPNHGKELIGTSDVLIRYDKGYKGQRNILKLWLPKEQRVFNFEKSEIKDYYSERVLEIADIQLLTQFKGTYKILATGKKRPFFIQAESLWRLSFGGELDKQVYLDLEEEF